MKAITIRQPWASLVALGVKMIETRSWRTDYRGPLAIHAAARRPTLVWTRWGEPFSGDGLLLSMVDDIRLDHLFCGDECDDGDGFWCHRWRGPLGAVVATCELVDVVPVLDRTLAISGHGTDGDHAIIDRNGALRMSTFSETDEPRGWQFPVGPGAVDLDITDQRPYGDFAPGRYAWLLADVQPIGAVPAKGKSRLWEWQP